MPPNTLRVHTVYVLVEPVGPKVLSAESRMQGTVQYFTPLQSHSKIVEGEIDGVSRHLSSLRGISPSLFLLLPVGCSRPWSTMGVLLAPCHSELHGYCSDYVRQVALATTTSTTSTQLC
ncbi:uncharacterized protein TNCV_5068881 [Trichonephila clavipes]|nr:uncharacterized protein TNCV_5068881 [Trichonephila clavipes]